MRYVTRRIQTPIQTNTQMDIRHRFNEPRIVKWVLFQRKMSCSIILKADVNS